MLVDRDKFVNMASKTILLLLIGIFAVEVFSVKICPHSDFVKKHVCTDCSNDLRKISSMALKVERTAKRDKPTNTQTIFSTKETESVGWILKDRGRGRGQSKNEIQKFVCEKRKRSYKHNNCNSIWCCYPHRQGYGAHDEISGHMNR